LSRHQLFHLSIPYKLRCERLHIRGPPTLIDFKKDQEDCDKINNWPGFIYRNINTPDIDAENLLTLIREHKGLITLC
jgi:hypothetical protein